MKKLLALALLASGPAFADADCGSTNPASPCTGTSDTHVVDGVTFTWTVSCSGSCQMGRFWDGTLWFRHPSGGSVSIVSVTPDDAASGLEKNPMTGSEVTSLTQGMYANATSDSVYSAAADISDELPYAAAADNGVYVKAKAYTGGDCGYNPASGSNCLDTFDAITVLVSVPDDGANGGNTFRPAMSGNTKLFVTTSDINLDLLPRVAGFTAGNYTTMRTRWGSPFPDFFRGRNGDYGRRWTPHARLPTVDYSVDRAEMFLNDLIGTFDTDSLTSAKESAVYAFVQYGMDLYGAAIEGVEQVTGAGQGQGAWLPTVIFATLYEGASQSTVKSNVAAFGAAIATTGNGSNVKFTELHQVRPNVDGWPIWGGQGGSSAVSDGCSGGGYSIPGSTNAGVYWADYADRAIDGGDGKRTCGDAYGMIDGIAEQPGGTYASCCSSGYYIGVGLVMKVWPELDVAANNPHMRRYAERLYNGAGWWTVSDQLARWDPREPSTCAPYTVAQTNSTCDYFGTTWGHDTVNNDGTGVTVAEATSRGHPSPTTRFPASHLAGRPNLDRCGAYCALWDTIVPRSGSDYQITVTITDDD